MLSRTVKVVKTGEAYEKTGMVPSARSGWTLGVDPVKMGKGTSRRRVKRTGKIFSVRPRRWS